HVAHQPELVRRDLRQQQTGVAAGKGNSGTYLVCQVFAKYRQYLLDDGHGSLTSHPQASDELVLEPSAVERLVYEGSATVHHHRWRACARQLTQPRSHRRAGQGIGHGVTAVFDDHTHRESLSPRATIDRVQEAAQWRD